MVVSYLSGRYFVRNRDRLFPSAPVDITTTCLTYLSFDNFKSGPCGTDEEMDARMTHFPFLQYAATYWGDHARGKPERTKEYLVRQFITEGTSRHSAAQIKYGTRIDRDSRAFPTNLSALSVAAAFGLKHIVRWLIKYGEDVNATDDDGCTALIRAAGNGHAIVARSTLPICEAC